MTIEPDERQARLDWMIEEFRKAQMRRAGKASVKAEPQTPSESDSKAPVNGSAASQ
jgi:hypothetical protein